MFLEASIMGVERWTSRGRGEGNGRVPGRKKASLGRSLRVRVTGQSILVMGA